MPPTDDDFNPHEFVEQTLSAFGQVRPEESQTEQSVTPAPETTGASVSSSPSTEESPTGSGISPGQEQQPAPTALTSEAEIEQLRSELEKKEKSYNHLQSDIDRRVNKGVEKAMAPLMEHIANLTGLVTRITQAPTGTIPEESQQYDYSNPAAVAKLVDARARQIVGEVLASDPRIQTATMVGDLAQFRGEVAQNPAFDFIAAKVFDKFPQLKDPKFLKANLKGAYEFAQELYEQAAKAVEEAAKTGGKPPQPPQQQIAGRISPEQANQLAQRASAAKVEAGVSAAPGGRPQLNFDNPNMREELQKLVAYQLSKK